MTDRDRERTTTTPFKVTLALITVWRADGRAGGSGA